MRWIAIATLVALVMLSCAGPGADLHRDPRPAPDGRWRQLPDGPLSGRRGAHALWVGDRLVVMGGTDSMTCPPNADCMPPEEPALKDGATYDPATGTWETMAEAPVPLGAASVALAGRTIYLYVYGWDSQHPSVREAFLAYDVRRDRWRELARPDTKQPPTLTPVRGTVVAFQSTQENGVEPDLIYDPPRDEWAELPLDPLRPSFDRSIVATAEGLVLFGIRNVEQPGVEPSFYRASILRGNRWGPLHELRVVGYNPLWVHVDGVLVNPAIQRIDGGETNGYGRFFPAGGIFDPRRETWSPLPEQPAKPGPFTGVTAAGTRYVLGGDGWVLDVQESKWLRLSRPERGPDQEAAAAWTDDGLVVWGGVDWKANASRLIQDGWIWTPAG